MYALQQSLIAAQGDGPALSNSVAATSILPPQAKFIVTPNYLDYVGRRVHFSAHGRVSNIVTTPGTLTFDLRLGGTVVWNGGPMQLSTTAHTNVAWWLDGDLTLRATGNAANFMGQGRFISQAANISGADGTQTHSVLLVPNTAPAVGGNFDATSALQLDLFATFSIANSGNALTLHQYEVTANILS